MKPADPSSRFLQRRFGDALEPLTLCLLLVTAVFFGLHLLYLSADFPGHSPWMDWSKYTDEGWYGDAAIRHFQLGHWYVPGDFNPAVALPVWPLLEALFFRFTGVSLSSARLLTTFVFAGILAASWVLLRGKPPTLGGTRAASAAVLLLAVSPFCFVFTRLAILEPLLCLLTLLALLTARSFPFVHPSGQAYPWLVALRANAGPSLGLALLLPAMVLTKTTGLFLTPAVLWMLWAAAGYRLRPFFIVALPAVTLSVATWAIYFFGVVRPRYLLDYQYLFSANGYTGISRAQFFSVLFWTLHGGFWMGRVIFWLALASAVLAVCSPRTLRTHPLVVALLLWAGGYAAFLAYHANLQPRYYLVIAVPLTLLVPLTFDQLLLPRLRAARAHRSVTAAAAAVFIFLVVNDARQTLAFTLRPQYTFLHAAQSIRDIIEQDHRKDPSHSALVLSISGSDLSLMTGLHSICDDFGTLELGDRVREYRPGWYAAWNEVDDDKMDALTPLFRLTRVAAFPVMDDPDRNLLILYRLDPSAPSTPPVRHRKPTPRALKTSLGQQPSTSQLEH